MANEKKIVSRKTKYLDPKDLESKRKKVILLPFNSLTSDNPPRLVSFSELAQGKTGGTKYTFSGFPILAQQLCDWFTSQNLKEITLKNKRNKFYKLFCYLTEVRQPAEISFVSLSRAYFTEFPDWYKAKAGKEAGETHQVLKYIHALRNSLGIVEEFYGTVRAATPIPTAIPTDTRKDIVKSVRSAAANVISKWLSVERVFEKGVDDQPIIQNYKTSADRRNWDDKKYIQMAEAARGEKISTPVNWLIKPERMPSSLYFTRGDSLLCLKHFCENYDEFPSPQNLREELVRLANHHGRSFDVAKFPLAKLGEFFYGDSEEIGILAAEILVQTGWNWQTLREINPWSYRLEPTSNNQRVKIFSTKMRTGKEQVANEPIQFDLESAQVHNAPSHPKKCYSPQLLELIISKTSPLRTWSARAVETPTLVEGFRLPPNFEKLQNSTWLVYFAAKKGSKTIKDDSKELPFKSIFDFNEFGRQSHKSDLLFRVTGKKDITARSLRRMVAQFNQTQFGMKSASLHCGHEFEVTTDNHYAGTNEYKASINGKIRVITSFLVENLAGRRLDFAEIRLNVEYINEPSVASKAIQNLKIVREYIGCADPLNPGINVTNKGLSGASECPFDRCVLCSNAFLFSDSYKFLARRLAELDHLLTRLPNIALTVKEFAAERVNLELILTVGYPSTNWRDIYTVWFKRFNSGELFSSY